MRELVGISGQRTPLPGAHLSTGAFNSVCSTRGQARARYAVVKVACRFLGQLHS